jgi:DNA anti-recombination protein RmuC
MRVTFNAVGRVLVLSGLLLLCTGCEDQPARDQAARLEKEIQSLQTRLDQMKAELKGQQDDFVALRNRLKSDIQEGMQGISDKVTKVQIDLEGKFTATNSQTSQNLLNQIKAVREDYEKRVAAVVSQDLAQALQGVRGDIDKLRGELIGYMDNQLKELYPYAFQPRRMDPREPPEKPQQ